MRNEEQRFALQEGRLYAAPGNVSAEALRIPACYAGPTAGGITVTYTAGIYDITDEQGAVVTSVRFGERTTVSGRLARFQSRVLAGLTGCPVQQADGSVRVLLGATAPGGKRQTVSLLLVCPLPSGEEFQVYARCAAATGTTLTLSREQKGGFSFSLSTLDGGGSLSLAEAAE